MYVEGIRDARRFVSALRAAARVKPVVALKVGRYAAGSRAASSHTGALVGSDAVFDAALRRCGTVRVKTYTQLFAAARILAVGAACRRASASPSSPTAAARACMAADSAAENGVPLAQLVGSRPSRCWIEKLPPQWSHGNPIDIIGDAPPQRFADATAAVLADPGVDALLAMYCAGGGDRRPRRRRGRWSKARASAAASRCSPPGWATSTRATAAPSSTSSGMPNFYTPENAVEAFSFLCAYRRNQAQLLRGAGGAGARRAGAPRPTSPARARSATRRSPRAARR